MIADMDEAVKTPVKKGLTIFHLKIIAYTTMFIDHVGAFVIQPYTDANLETMGYRMMRLLDTAYEACRIIGRIAFPLFCFMLVEGLFHTHNRWRYLIRLLIFAVLSDIPYDLADGGILPNWEKQSVMITLSIGLLVLILMEEIKKLTISVNVRNLLIFLPVAGGALLAHFAKCDYSFRGVLVISALYLLYPLFTLDRKAYVVGGGILFFWEWMNKYSRVTASIAYIPLYFYNGEKGKGAKWFFYCFYPVHLLLLYGIRCYLMQ